MPKRVSTRRVTGGPQGDDAYVVLKRLNWDEQRALRQRLRPFVPESSANGDNPLHDLDLADKGDSEMLNILSEQVLEWNWVADEAGEKPLPQPKGNPEILGQLLDNEKTFLIQAAMGEESEEKKVPSTKR
jgi:hypothetical protein